MSDPITKLQEELRGSSTPVSAFFLITSSESISLMVQRLHTLCSFGVTAKQVDAIADTVTDALLHYTPDNDYYRRCELQFQVNDECFTGEFCYIRNIPGKGFEVEVTLPGIIASSACGFVDNKNGFWTAFMPPGFYR